MTTKLSPGSQTVEDTRTKPRTDDGDHERFSHYVPKNKLTDAMVNGTPVIALCGKVWVPSRDRSDTPSARNARRSGKASNVAANATDSVTARSHASQSTPGYAQQDDGGSDLGWPSSSTSIMTSASAV